VAISGDDARWSQVRREHDVVLSSIQTAGREDRFDFVEAFLRMRTTPTFVVVDEAHHASANGYYRLVGALRRHGCPLIGLTATPVRMDEADERRLHALFDRRLIYQITRRELIDLGVLASPSFETIETRVDVEREFTPDDYKHLERYGDLAPAVLARLATNATRNGLIVRQYKEHAHKYGPTIVFATDTLHARTLAKEFQTAGVDADFVDYGRGDAQAVIEKYQARRGPQVLVNVEMLTEGFDAPHTRTVFIARPTNSEGLLSQMVGRALRGGRSGGNDVAFLVTFVDTWKQFDVLDTEYAVRGGEVTPPPAPQATEPRRSVPIPPELIHEAYRLVMSAVNAELTGVFACLPHSWYAWEQTFDDDVRRRLVMVFEHQVEGWEALNRAFPDTASIPTDLDEDRARELVREHFGDIPDPLPRWGDVLSLLEARRDGCEIHHYTFEEKRTFDPKVLARTLVERGLGPLQQRDHLLALWNESPACKSVYRNDFRTFQDEVSREINDILSPPQPPPPPELVRAVPKDPPRAWGPTEIGHSLVEIRDEVAQNRRHFPSGPPQHGQLVWSRKPLKNLWGFCRFSDMRITINSLLDSPDVPRFVLEFLMFHELLHAEMPHAMHNADFRARERMFAPSPAAAAAAASAGITPGSAPGAWRALADMFLDTFEHRFATASGKSVSY
jgi:hypothetical protein